MKYYILLVWEDIEPQIRGPYKDAANRDLYAKRLRHKCGAEEHGVFALDVNRNGKPKVSAYSQAFMWAAD